MTTANTMDKIFVRFQLVGEQEMRTIPITDFFKLDSQQLNAETQKIRRVLNELYKLNDRNPPLFHEFPDRGKDMPLVVDCKLYTNKSGDAAYEEEEHRLEFSEDTLKESEANLLIKMAHELKHAEQYSTQQINMQHDIEARRDGLAWYQMRFLEEAQAYAFGDYVSYLAYINGVFPGQKAVYYFPDITSPILKTRTKEKQVVPLRDIEYDMVEKILPALYYNDWYDSYKHEEDKQKREWTISKEDKGLATIARSFNFEHPNMFFALIQKLPREEFPQREEKKDMVNLAQNMQQQNGGR